jgi:hypothetical protein
MDSTVVIGSGVTKLGMVTCYGLDGRGIRVQFPAGARDFSLLHIIQISSRAH